MDPKSVVSKQKFIDCIRIGHFSLQSTIFTLLCFRHLSESHFLLGILHRRSKFANFFLDLMQNHLS